jgi:hypothetical protein
MFNNLFKLKFSKFFMFFRYFQAFLAHLKQFLVWRPSWISHKQKQFLGFNLSNEIIKSILASFAHHLTNQIQEKMKKR